MKRALVVGGANGIGLSIAKELALRDTCEKVYIVDKAPLADEYEEEKIESFEFDLTATDFSFFDRFSDIDTLMITAGFGKLALFQNVEERHIVDSFNVNTIAAIRVIKHFYDKLLSKDDFHCGVMVSISGFMSSPFFAVYGATKAALKIFIESVNVELEKAGTSNRILNVSPGSIKGTSFNAGKTDLAQTHQLAVDIISHLDAKDDLYIPQYDEVFKDVLERYHKDFRAEGLHSYDYKVGSGRVKNAVVTGGTKGIGKAITKMLLDEGYNVTATYSSDDNAAKDLMRITPPYQQKRLTTMKVDQSDRTAMKRFAENLKTCGHIDCVVCNAGSTLRKSLQDIEDDDWQRVMDINVNSNVFLIRDLMEVIPQGSRIVMIGSEMGIYPHGTSLAYGVTKSAIHALAKNLVKCFEGTNTTVNAIAPGFVETEWQKDKPQEIRNNIYNKTAIHRFATVEEIADAVRFCIRNGFVNGSIIEVSGGYCYK